jgi:dipeptidyl-peptidase-4
VAGGRWIAGASLCAVFWAVTVAATGGPLQALVPVGSTHAEGGASVDPVGQEDKEGREALPARIDAETPQTFFDPVLRLMEGWTVRVDPVLLEGRHAEEGGRALTMLANHLQRIRILVPQPQLGDLQKVGIWIEWDHPRLHSMQYHPSQRWLVANRHDPRLVKQVHITQARDLLSRSEMLKHPAVILHELAHGYHDQVLGFEHPEIVAAYERAKEAGIYEDVLLYTGERVRHYGLSNHKEYFAEGTEAYFYRNDFHPFVRAELREFDPMLHDLLERIWSSVE